MATNLTNKTVLVTGASRGIGLHTVQALAEQGATVIGVARDNSAELSNMAAEIVTADLATAEGPAEAVAAVRDRHGPIDVLVNNVGAFTARTEGFAAVSDAQWQHTFEINFFSAVRAIRAALPDLLEQRGVIVNISSINGRTPQPPVVDYAAAKAALTNLSVGLAQELGPQGVQVTTVSPGPTRTPAWTSPNGFGADLAAANGLSHDEFLRDIGQHTGIPTGRLTDPAEVAAVVALLASGKAPNAHGADWAIDGNQSGHT